MFGQPLAIWWQFLAATYRKMLKPLFQCLLQVVLHRGVVSLAVIYCLYSVAEYTFSDWYFAVKDVWKPAFPSSWRILFLSLFVVPAFASIQLVWLVLQRVALSYNWRRCLPKARSIPSREYRMLPRSESSSFEEARVEDDSGFALTDVERDTTPPRTSSKRTFPFFWLLQFVVWFVVLCASLRLALDYRHPGDLRYLPLIEHANAHPKPEGYADNERIFIAAMFSNNEQVIPYWSDSLVKVIPYLGKDNVFVSILESKSGDRSPELLRQLDDRLAAMGVSRRILTEDTTIAKPGDMNGNHRIDYLSALRNRVLEPLVEMGGYDKVVFSNDVYIEPESLVELLKTADGKYDMVCGMDYGIWGLYDLWVIRDKQGRLPSGIWPYFFDQENYEAIQTESPVSVFACWNGIVAFTADPILPIHLRSNKTLSRDPLPFKLPATHPAASDPTLLGPSPALTPPIGFRSSVPNECFSSECFLLPYDMRRMFGLGRMWVNTRVVVAYEWRFYIYFKWFMRHPVLRWWIEKVYDGAWMQKDIFVVGDAKHLWTWDGGDCHPWW